MESWKYSDILMTECFTWHMVDRALWEMSCAEGPQQALPVKSRRFPCRFVVAIKLRRACFRLKRVSLLARKGARTSG